MDRYQQAALLDFVASVIWPTRTVAIAGSGGQATFNILGVWDTAHDVAMAWINGNRVSGTITWVTASRVTLPVTAPQGSQVIILVSPGAGTGYLARSGLAAMLGALDMGAQRIEHLGASVEADDAVRRDEVQSIALALVGGNYVAKAGDTMTGPLHLPAAAGITDDDEAVRRDMVALLDGLQAFTGAQKGIATIDAMDDLTLATKGYLLGKVGTLILPPNRFALFTVAGPTTWVVPSGLLGGMAFIWARGGAGGGGGGSPLVAPGGYGASGGYAGAQHTVTPSATLNLTVGGGGGGGGASGGGTGGGGGGGGASTFDVSLVAGGGGGGAGASGATGGAGGSAGAAGSGGGGGAAGVGGTASGGVGGSGSAGHGGDGSGTRGSDNFNPFATPADVWPASSGYSSGVTSSSSSGGFGGPGSAGAAGAVLIMWRE